MDESTSKGFCKSYSSKSCDVYDMIYVKALKSLNHQLYTKGEEIRFVSLGRKGIKIFECLPKYSYERVKGENTNGQRRRIPDIVSEYALPFIFQKEKVDKGKATYCLLDDALYYGSSALGVAKAIYAFKKVYENQAMPEKIDYFSAIDTGELRLNFHRYIGNIFATSTMDENLASSYSHFFVKRLASDIRSLENTFEVEFPIITFSLDVCPEKVHWMNALKAVYGDNGARVYIVDHEENYSINVLLPKNDGSSFTKLRLFPSKSGDNNQSCRVKIVCMAPHPIADEDLVFRQLFENADEGYKGLWRMIYERCHIDISMANENNIVDYLTIARPRCNKSLVIMANYLLSFSTIVEERNRLEELFGQMNVQYNFKGIDSYKDLYYLLGDKKLSKDVGNGLEKLYNDRRSCGTVYTAKGLRVNYNVFENSKKIEDQTLFLLGVQNDYMMENSQNVEEALGVLFFNQDMFFEKQELASNPVTQDYHRLRMGFTYEGLQDIIQDSLARGYFTLKPDEDFVITLHRWVDQRIGEASIVPQYVLDDKSKYWIRVFRHGENEETLLSHLARFVLFVFNERANKTYLEWIPKDELKNLLVNSFNKIEGDTLESKKKQIVESTNICIKVESDELVFTNDHYPVLDQTGKPRSVLDYMIKMCILSEDEQGVITIHPRTKSFFKTGITTMSSQSEKEIRKEIYKYSS